MKRQLTRAATLLVALGMMVSSAGCVGVNFMTGFMENGERGEGPLIETTYPGGDYTIADIRANLEVVYSSQPSNTVRVELQENLLPYLHVTVSDGRLQVDSDRGFLYDGKTVGRIYVNAPVLEKMYLSGATTLKDSDTISGDSFTLDLSGAAEVKMDFDLRELRVVAAGACDLRLSGETDEMDVEISGAGSLDSRDLQAKNAKVEMSGAGSAVISCSDQLDAVISGAGSLEYYGNPDVRKDIGGAGSVRQR